MPVLRRTSAIEDIQHLVGSSARKPHSSSRLKPLFVELARKLDERKLSAPHAEHVNQVLFGDVVFPVHVPLQCSKDTLFLHQILAAFSFDTQEGIVGDTVCVGGSVSIFRRNRKVLELFAEDYNSLFTV